MMAIRSKIKTGCDLILKKGVPVDRFGFPLDAELNNWIGVYNTCLILNDHTYAPHVVKYFNDRQDKILMEKGGGPDFKNDKQSNQIHHENNN